MKVVISTYTFLPDIGGVASVVANLASAFQNLGHEVTVVTLTSGNSMDFPYRVVRQPSIFQLTLTYAGADLLILSNLSLKLAYPLFFIPRGFALHHHSESAFYLSNRWCSADRLRRMLFLRATHFMTSAYIGKKSRCPDYLIAPPFPSLDQFTADAIKPIASRRDAVFVGRIEPEKGIDWLLQRWGRFQQMLDVERLHVVGAGSILPSLEKRFSGAAQIVFHGAQPREQVARVMGSCKYVLIPSLWEEPFGAVALEALAAEAIPILSNRGGLPEAVPGFGHYFNPDDEESVNEALNSARIDFDHQSTDAEARIDWQRKARAHLANFEPAHVAQRMIERVCG